MAPAPHRANPEPSPPRKPNRLVKRAEFLRVAAGGRRVAVHGLVLQALARTDPGPARLGFTVTKKVGNAVVRNRTRRRLKEAARQVLLAQPLAGVDLVLIGRDTTRGRNFAALVDDFGRALAKLGVPPGTKLGVPAGTKHGVPPRATT